MPKLAGEIFGEASSYPLTIIPLFVLMGNLAGVSGMSRDLYNAAHAWLGHLKGGLASATVVGCAGFSALSGSSLAAALTMGRVSLPEMKRFRYDDGLATGAVAAGGTLGILIPPSAGFVIYAILTEQSIGRLFLAGVLPGLLLTLLFILAIWLVVARTPDKAPQIVTMIPLAKRLQALARASWIIGIILLTIGGIYGGIFSAIEAAGIGASLAFLVAADQAKSDQTEPVRGFSLNTPIFRERSFSFYSVPSFSSLSSVSPALRFRCRNGSRRKVSVGFRSFLPFFSCSSFSARSWRVLRFLVLTVPLIQPIIEPLGIDLIWFGVLMVIALEMGLISPPVGINVFVVKGIAQDVSLGTIFRGIWPFWFAMLAALVLILLVPSIALFLPNTDDRLVVRPHRMVPSTISEIPGACC